MQNIGSRVGNLRTQDEAISAAESALSLLGPKWNSVAIRGDNDWFLRITPKNRQQYIAITVKNGSDDGKLYTAKIETMGYFENSCSADGIVEAIKNIQNSIREHVDQVTRLYATIIS